MRSLFIAIGLAGLLTAGPVHGDVSESNVWSETYPVSSATPRLSISNIWGSVKVRAGDDGEIRVTVDERRSAPDQGLFDRSKELLKLDTLADAAGVSMVVGNPDDWNQRNHCRNCRVDYQFEVVVPRNAIVEVSTVMDGMIDVAGVAGGVSASNVNGPIAVDGISNCSAVDNVNGRISLSFAAPPGMDCSIETINGDVTLTMPAGSGLDVALDIFNGDVVTEFATDAFALPAEVHYEQKDGENRYRIQQSAGLRLEGGGPTFSISSMNGDVKILKN